MAGISWRGRRACQCVIDYVSLVEDRMGHSVTIYQASYNTSVGASAGTHSGGGALDLANYSQRDLTILREAGGAAWHRTPSQGFIHHAHIIICGCPHVSRDAAFQVSEYRAGRNGLAGRGRDDGPRVKIISWPQVRAGLKAAAVVKRPKTMTIQGKAYPYVGTVSVYWLNQARGHHGKYVNRHAYWLQVWLKKTGHYSGPLDGRFGAVTQAALNRFRKSLGWKGSDITGPVGIRSLTLLRNKAGSTLAVKKGK